jgi:hypothetical protein
MSRRNNEQQHFFMIMIAANLKAMTDLSAEAQVKADDR